MEESGHYYSVYLTSLAVGYPEHLAYTQAYYAQLPDELTTLDAATLHSKIKIESSAEGQRRARIEKILHALTGNIAVSEMNKTKNAIFKKQFLSDSMEFGFLLHRLGDTFAHRREDNINRLYSITTENRFITYNCEYETILKSGKHIKREILFYENQAGHAVDSVMDFVLELFKDGSDPDNWWRPKRLPLYRSYIYELYSVLENKAISENKNLKKKLPCYDLINKIENEIKSLNNHHILDQRHIISKLRLLSDHEFGIKLREYAPEWSEPKVPDNNLNDLMEKTITNIERSL